jgi:hypothetical protein
MDSQSIECFSNRQSATGNRQSATGNPQSHSLSNILSNFQAPEIKPHIETKKLLSQGISPEYG